MIFPLAGVNIMHLGDQSLVVDPTSVTLCALGDVYRVSHPHGSGEITVQVTVPGNLMVSALASRDERLVRAEDRPFAARQVPRSPKLHLQLVRLLTAARSAFPEALEIEESTLGLLDAVAGALSKGRAIPPTPVSDEDRDLAVASAALLAARHSESLGLDQVATALGVSKFRLCRVFKRVNGETLWQRVQQLRARRAAVELAAGANDLSALGLSLGYSSHSHFTQSFRRVFGSTPSALRTALAAG